MSIPSTFRPRVYCRRFFAQGDTSRSKRLASSRMPNRRALLHDVFQRETVESCLTLSLSFLPDLQDRVATLADGVAWMEKLHDVADADLPGMLSQPEAAVRSPTRRYEPPPRQQVQNLGCLRRRDSGASRYLTCADRTLGRGQAV